MFSSPVISNCSLRKVSSTLTISFLTSFLTSTSSWTNACFLISWTLDKIKESSRTSIANHFAVCPKSKEIPPDNNLAERALRLAVTKRKVSGGSRSMKRFEDTADNLSVIQTCRFQGRSVSNFFASALKASVGIEEQPSLVPDFCT